MKLGEIVAHMDNYNFTKFHQNQMKNKKVLLTARFSVESVESWKSYIVCTPRGWKTPFYSWAKPNCYYRFWNCLRYNSSYIFPVNFFSLYNNIYIHSPQNQICLDNPCFSHIFMQPQKQPNHHVHDRRLVYGKMKLFVVRSRPSNNAQETRSQNGVRVNLHRYPYFEFVLK